MTVRVVRPERIYAAQTYTSTGGHQGTLVNEAGTILWHCAHNHREYHVAVRCAEAERRRWVRAGKAPQ